MISLKQTNYKTPILIIILLTITIRTVPINANENDTLSLTINLPAESLVILNETGYTPDSRLNYEWTCNKSISGTEISANEYEEVKNLPNQFEQYAFFDSLNYEEGKKAYGQVIADKKGNIYFILRNNHNEPIIVIIELTYRTTIQPWLLGLIIATITVVVLLIGLIIAVKLRQKMLEESKEETELSPQQKYWET